MEYIEQKLWHILGKNYGIYYGIYWAKVWNIEGKTIRHIRLNLWDILGKLMGYIELKVWVILCDIFSKNYKICWGNTLGYIGQKLKDILSKNYAIYWAKNM